MVCLGGGLKVVDGVAIVCWPIPGVFSPERELAAAAMARPPGAPRGPVLRFLQGLFGDGERFRG